MSKFDTTQYNINVYSTKGCPGIRYIIQGVQLRPPGANLVHEGETAWGPTFLGNWQKKNGPQSWENWLDLFSLQNPCLPINIRKRCGKWMKMLKWHQICRWATYLPWELPGVHFLTSQHGNIKSKIAGGPRQIGGLLKTIARSLGTSFWFNNKSELFFQRGPASTTGINEKNTCILHISFLGGGFKCVLCSPRSLGKWSNLTCTYF